MVYVDPEFEVPTVPDDEKYEGTEIDKHVLEGAFVASRTFLLASENIFLSTEQSKPCLQARVSYGFRPMERAFGQLVTKLTPSFQTGQRSRTS